ncbi:MAG: carbohydrate-binding domain-containing protein, partial [Candidatus Electryonea clarkiae]|nr:carbohydrate-binding domain-containing protein [Candidatus Electryonea clarkiae]
SSGGDQPGQVTLEWSPNSEPDLAGYRVFLREDGQSYDYTNPSWEGTGAMCTIYDLDDTKTYYFVARAFDSEGFESGDSNEVCLAQTSGSGGEKIIEAEDMPIKTTGGSTTDGWNIWSNGYIADDVNFQTEGTYTFDVTAKGSFAGGAWPIMEVRIDQTNVATVTVDSSNWTVYTIEAYVTSGMHEVAIAFTNDYYNSPEDRNLLIDKIIVTESGNNEPPIANAGQDQTTDAGQLVTLEAEDMPIKTTGGSTTDGWNIWSNGYIADDVNFQTEGTYTFDVTAKGSFAGGAWPIMEVRIDQTNVGTVTVDSSNWTVYTIEAYVTSGTHEVAIAFTNDYYNSPEDRNLLIDKIIVTDAGQLVTLNGSNSTDPDDGIASYHWVQTGGTPVTLSDPNSQQATFTAPGVETTGVSLTFELTVVDHGGLENMDTCVVNVIW